MAKPTTAPDDADPNAIMTLTITLPEWMFDDMKSRADRRSISVTELIRRAVSLERMLFEEHDSVVTLINERLGTSQTVRML